MLAALIGRDRGAGGVHVEIAQREVASQVLEAVLRGGAWRPFPSADAAVLAAHPRLVCRGFLAATVGAICHHFARPPWNLYGVSSLRERPAPLFGADSASVLAGLGHLDGAEIERLVRDNVVRTSRDAPGGPPNG